MHHLLLEVLFIVHHQEEVTDIIFDVDSTLFHDPFELLQTVFEELASKGEQVWHIVCGWGHYNLKISPNLIKYHLRIDKLDWIAWFSCCNFCKLASISLQRWSFTFEDPRLKELLLRSVPKLILEYFFNSL